MKFFDTALVDCPYKYAVCVDEKKFKKALKRLSLDQREWPDFIHDGKDATVHYLENPEVGNFAIVCINPPDDDNDTQIIGLLVHEAVHIWQESKIIIGDNNPSQEFEAYSIQRIAQDLISEYRRKTSRKEGKHE